MIRRIILISASALTAAAQPANHLVSLVVLDRQGQNVLDLKSDELQVLDDGHKQPIASFARRETASALHTVILLGLMNTAPSVRINAQQQTVQSLQAPAPAHLFRSTFLPATVHCMRSKG